MTIFASDNVTTACPEIMDALVKANSGNVDSYGDDKWSESLKKKMSDLFETNVEVFITVTGTAANSLALSALTPGFGNIYCCLLYTSPSPRDLSTARMPSSA